MGRLATFLLVAVWLLADVAMNVSAISCGECPICDHASYLDTHCLLPSIWGLNSASRASREIKALYRCVQFAFSQKIVGHDEIKEELLRLTSHKLLSPAQPAVYHFAGDNGVGKTMMAKELSLATSRRRKRGPSCGPTQICDFGDNMLEISCPGYGLVSPDVAAVKIIDLVSEHARNHPFGIVLLDDVSSLHPTVVAALSPLLGNGQTFEAHPLVSLGGLTVIMTSDFGKEGRTRGRAMEVIRQLAQDELRHIYAYANVKHVKTFAFMPFGTESAESLVRAVVSTTPCRIKSVSKASVSAGAVRAIVEGLNEAGSIVQANGRAVMEEVLAQVDAKIAYYLLEQGMDLSVHVTLKEGAGGLVLHVSPDEVFAQHTPDAEL